MQKVKIYSLIFCVVTLLSLGTTNISAKKVLPRVLNPGSTNASSKSLKGITTSVRFRSDRRALIVTFDNLQIASSVNYVLTYTTDGTEQGFQGSVSTTLPSPQTREIVFGTCSSGACRYDTKPTNAKLQITTTLKTGKKVIKTYRIKI